MRVPARISSSSFDQARHSGLWSLGTHETAHSRLVATQKSRFRGWLLCKTPRAQCDPAPHCGGSVACSGGCARILTYKPEFRWDWGMFIATQGSRNGSELTSKPGYRWHWGSRFRGITRNLLRWDWGMGFEEDPKPPLENLSIGCIVVYIKLLSN